MGFVEGDVGEFDVGVGEIGLGLAGWVVAPGAYGVEVGLKLRREVSGDGFVGELVGEVVGEVLEHDEVDEDGVTRGPGGGSELEDAEFDGEVVALGGDGGVDSLGVELQRVELIGWEGGEGVFGGGAELEGALGAVVRDHGGTEDLGQFSGGVAAEGLHLPEAVLCGDVALGDDEVIEGCGLDVGDAVGVALDGDGCAEAGDREGAIELGEGCLHGMPCPESGSEEDASEHEEEDGEEDGEDFGEDGGFLVLRAFWSI